MNAIATLAMDERQPRSLSCGGDVPQTPASVPDHQVGKCNALRDALAILAELRDRYLNVDKRCYTAVLFAAIVLDDELRIARGILADRCAPWFEVQAGYRGRSPEEGASPEAGGRLLRAPAPSPRPQPEQTINAGVVLR